jgi:signal transduction histidine kinase
MAGFRLFADIAPISMIVTGALILMASPYRKEPAVQSLMAYIALIVFLLGASLAELFAPTNGLKVACAQLEYLAYLYIPVAWLSFSLRYTGWISETRKSILTLAIIGPALAFSLVATNGLHGLLWRELVFARAEGLGVLRPVYGPLFPVIAVYLWGGMIFGAGLIFRSYFSSQPLFHRQSVWILVGALMPGVFNLINVLRIFPGFQKDFTPIGFALSGFLVLLGMYFHRLLWVMPVSRGALFQEMSQAIVIIDDFAHVVDHNHSADTILGLDVVSVGKLAGEYPRVAEVLSETGFVPGLAQFEPKAGRISLGSRFYDWSLQPVRLHANCVMLVLEDVSAEAALEREVSQIKDEFVKRERLASVGKLTAGLAHEINNPLAYIKSDLRSLNLMVERQDLMDPEEAAEIRDITKGITEGLERIERVVGSLLSFSRQGRVDLPVEPYDLRVGIELTLDVMRADYRDLVDIEGNYGEVPPFLAKKSEINQVFFNILSNAVRAVKQRTALEPEGKFRGLITVKTWVEDGMALCEIGNNGAPIREEDRERIFELFFTTQSEGWGTGLGLNLSRDIVERGHGGRLTLASLSPVAFRVQLPLYEQLPLHPQLPLRQDLPLQAATAAAATTVVATTLAADSTTPAATGSAE